MCPVSTGSASRMPLPRKLLGQVLHQDGFAAGTEEDMGLGSGQSPGAGTDPHVSPGRHPPTLRWCTASPLPIPVCLMTAVTVMGTAQEGAHWGTVPLPSENPRTALCADPLPQTTALECISSSRVPVPFKPCCSQVKY